MSEPAPDIHALSPLRSVAPINVDALLTPIPGPHPTGISVRYSGDYERIEEARREEDPGRPMGVWQRDLKRADWDAVVNLCSETLTQRSKDLRVASWLLEALVHRHGYAALGVGFQLVAGLCERFWPSLFPELEDGTADARARIIEWLNERVPRLLNQLPICAPQREGRAFSFGDYCRALRLKAPRAPDLNQAESAVIGNPLALSAIEDSLRSTPSDFFEMMRDDLASAQEAVAKLTAVLDGNLTPDPPSLGNVQSTIEEISGLAVAILSQRGMSGAQKSSQDTSQPSSRQSADTWSVPAVSEDDGAAGWLVTSGKSTIRNREEAYQILAEVAAYLRRIEPHSPTSYLIERAVRWGELPLRDLMMDICRDGQGISPIFDLLGISNTEQN
ncbi:MAG: type VI secretion system protein TssA [Candidatus Binatia bacterium]